MRPLRLEIEGFTAYRARTVVDFTDTDLFVLVGPTGSGKSSVIDAICFALYGCVPRYDDERLVAPAISQGQNEAKVRLDFAMDGREYTAVRVIRRDAKGRGASTKEARLEQAETVLAGNADQVTAEVTRLLGLDFSQFTRCVVLPQGAFARFLHDKPKDRQALLVKLLDLEVYQEMGRLARGRAEVSAGRIEIIQKEIESLSHATPQAHAEALERTGRLERLREQVAAMRPALEAVEKRMAELAARAADAARWEDELAEVAVPPGAAGLAAEAGALAEACRAAETAAAAAAASVGEAQAARDDLPGREAVAAALQAHDALAGVAPALQAAQLEAERAEQELEAAAEAWRRAGEALDKAAERHTSVQNEHRAHVLAATLETGQPCPVCDQVVVAVPSARAPSDLEQARLAEQAARSALDDAGAQRTGAEKAAAAAAAEAERLTKQRETLSRQTADYPDAGEAARLLSAIDAAAESLARAKDEEIRAGREAASARSRLDAARQKSEEARAEFDARRDRLGALGPPAPARTDLAEDWRALAEWAAARRRGFKEAAAAFEAELGSAEQEKLRIAGAILDACASEGIASTAAAATDDVAAALAEARAAAAEISRDIEASREKETHLKVEQAAAATAREAGRHLAASGFEKWLLVEAIEQLTIGASTFLGELSEGRYSMDLDSKSDFEIVDHSSAGARRSARTLSGGETFLASLALSLALAGHLAQLASAGPLVLESIFLDEGFGTLDDEALAVVAAAIEKLGASGRMVGIVTHRRELAERIPVRFEVRNVAGSATVEKVVL